MKKFYNVTKKSAELLFTEEVIVQYDENLKQINVLNSDGKVILSLDKLSFATCVVTKGDFYNPNNLNLKVM